ncbi:hypothetical protein [Arsenophonus sp. PmNCSU2021_1]|uniref:hypothetical protein n=1 Tax=Arsenophonus sp. PmNCSU2021_1 TaxID=3118989 RepID=UPI002FF22541
MSFLTIDVDNYDNGDAYEPTKTIGINFEAIEEIKKGGKQYIPSNIPNGPNINIYPEVKYFKTIKERDDYFEYIASKLEVIDLSPKENRKG